METRDTTKDAALEASLLEVFKSHGYSEEESVKLARDCVKLANGAHLSFTVPLYTGKTCPR